MVRFGHRVAYSDMSVALGWLLSEAREQFAEGLYGGRPPIAEMYVRTEDGMICLLCPSEAGGITVLGNAGRVRYELSADIARATVVACALPLQLGPWRASRVTEIVSVTDRRIPDRDLRLGRYESAIGIKMDFDYLSPVIAVST